MKDAPLRHAVEHGLFQLLRGLVRVVPHANARALGRALGGLAYRALPRRRQLALDNLQQALPELDGARRVRIARGAFASMTSHALEMLSWSRFDAAQLCRHWTLEGWDHALEAAASSGSLFVMTAHFGPWEVLGPATSLYLPPVSALVRPLDNPRLEAALSALRTRFGLSLIHKHGAARQLVRSLDAGGRLIVLIDQRVGAREAIEVPFFGRPVRTTALIARLAVKHETSILPLFAYPSPGGRYRIVARPALAPDPTAEDPIYDLTARASAAVEKEVRSQPDLWLWMHDRWRLT
jgi:KDO2-lipid IV(A) lauroyltransferase